MKVEERHLTGIAFEQARTAMVRFTVGEIHGETATWFDVFPDLKISVASQLAVDRPACEVQLGCEFTGAEPWELSVEVCGWFSVPEGRESAVALDVFAEKHAVAILMPYLRQVISSVTADSVLGALLLPPINVVALVEEAKEEVEQQDAEATAPTSK